MSICFIFNRNAETLFYFATMITCVTLVEFFLNIFHWIQQIQWQKIYYIKRTRTFYPATSCVRDQHVTTAPARHMWEIGSLNWAQYQLQWFVSFSEFTELSERSGPFRKNSNIVDIIDMPALKWHASGWSLHKSRAYGVLPKWNINSLNSWNLI